MTGGIVGSVLNVCSLGKQPSPLNKSGYSSSMSGALLLLFAWLSCVSICVGSTCWGTWVGGNCMDQSHLCTGDCTHYWHFGVDNVKLTLPGTVCLYVYMVV